MHRRNNFRFAKLAVAFCFLLAFTLFTAGAQSALAQSIQYKQAPVALMPPAPEVGHVPDAVQIGTAVRVSHYNPDQKLRLALGVQPPHMAEEEQFIKELVTKGSPNFHKFLTAEEWNARFAPSAADEQAVVDWAQSVGLTVTNRYPNRLLVDVEGTAGTIEKAFGVTINNYQVGDEVDFSNDRPAVIPSNLSGIICAVLGLQNINRMHGMTAGTRNVKGPDYAAGAVYTEGEAHHRDGDPTRKPSSQSSAMAFDSSGTPRASNSPSTGGINPSDLYSSEGYDYAALSNLDHCCNVHNDSGGSPAVSSIAIVAWNGPDLSGGGDIATFASQYGLAYNITPLWIDGTSPTPSQCNTLNGGTCTGDGDDDEVTVDTEYTTAYANSFGSYLDTAHVYIYEPANTQYSTFADTYNYIVSNNYAKVVTTSYDWTDAGFGSASEMNTLHGIFNTMVGGGWTLINASGDQGAASGCTDADLVFWPAEDPDFLAAGGTALDFDTTTGDFVSEVAWTGGTGAKSCSSNGGGGGGGVSTFFPIPSWQELSGSSLTYEYYDPSDSTYWVVSGNGQRLLPDVSLNAGGTGENYYYKGSWGGVLGTSIVAPQLAGFFARENTYLNWIGNICGSGGTSACTPVGLASPFIYENGNNQTHHYPFYDTLTGCNSNNITAEYSLDSYCATTGWDAATGWGSANMMQLAWGINWQLIPAYSQPAVTFVDQPAKNVWFNSDQVVSWKVTDGLSEGSGTPSGVAGFTQGWDTIPADPYSEPTPGSGNSFYSGPQYPTVSTSTGAASTGSGCLSFNGADGCASAPSPQGCHTAWVEGWDNQGGTAYGSYGPVCYDTVAPTITLTTSPAGATSYYTDHTVTVTLTSTDPGGSNASGIAATYYGISTGNCYPGNLGGCAVYSSPFTISTQGQTYVYYFTVDRAGNYSAETYQWIYIDTTKPVTSASLSGTISSGSIYKTAVQVTLSATTTGYSGVANTYYEIDGGAQTSYSGPFTISALGSHSVKYWSVSVSGEVETAKTTSFSIASPTNATLVATPNPALLGGSVKMTATITATLSGTPTGTVTFWNGATNLGTGTLSSGVATLSTTALPAGLNTLQVSYPATGNFLAINSVPFDETVNENTTTTVTSSLNPVVYGGTVTLTAQVTPSSSGTPTGSVSFYSGSTLVGFESLNGSGIATLPTNSLPGGANYIKGIYSGDSTYLTSTSAVLTETVDKASQTITFANPGTQTVGTPLTLSATASSGLAVTFLSVTTSVCTVSGTTAKFIAEGTCEINAHQAGNSDYTAAPLVQQSFTVNPEAQTITFANPGTQTVGTPLTLSATASSGLAVTFLSATTSVCTVSGTTAKFIAEGTCEIHAHQAGNNIYAAAPLVSQSFTVNPEAQTITFANPGTQTVGTPLALSAKASSGLAVALTPTTTSVCMVSGTTATFIASGKCTIDANQAGNNAYAAAPLVEQTFTVNGEAQTITFANPGTQTVGTPLALSATASSGLAVTFLSATTSVCTVSGTTAKFIAAGTCQINAHQAGNSTYAAAPLVSQSFNVVVAD